MPKPFQGVHPFLTQALCPLNSYHQTPNSTQQFLKKYLTFPQDIEISRYLNAKYDSSYYLPLYWLGHIWKGRRTLLVFKYFKQTASFVSLWTFKSCKGVSNCNLKRMCAVQWSQQKCKYLQNLLLLLCWACRGSAYCNLYHHHLWYLKIYIIIICVNIINDVPLSVFFTKRWIWPCSWRSIFRDGSGDGQLSEKQVNYVKINLRQEQSRKF